jgi:hypothetical protein
MSTGSPEASFNQVSTYPERLEQWRGVDATINELSKRLYGTRIDPGVNELVIGLNAVLGGYFTRASCEGHVDTSTSPWITFSLAAAYDVETEQMRFDGLTGLLDEFYGKHDVDAQLRLGIFPISDTQSAYELTTAIGNEFLSVDPEDIEGYQEVSQKAVELLGPQQNEVTEFATFVREKFLSGFVIAK